VIRVPTHVGQLKGGEINPCPSIEVVEDHGGSVVLEGDNGLGQLTTLDGIEVAIYCDNDARQSLGDVLHDA
jgi:LDH2 family malate/lactate/ureidoglycolate dehydrogenase